MGIVDIYITIDIENSLVTFWNIYIKPYSYHIKKINNNYFERTNNLAEQPANKKIFLLFVYLEIKKLCQWEQLEKSYFINNFINVKIDIFISYKKRVNYKPALKLYHNRVIFILDNSIE